MSDPRIWGWDAWKFLHRSAIAYPAKPSDEQKQRARNFFEALPLFIPCPSCAVHYKKYFDTTFSDETLKSSKTLSKWIYELHETVNKRLGVDSGVKLEDVPKVVNKFPSRYIDLDTGYILQKARYADEYGVSAPHDKEGRDWLEAHPGMSLNDRPLLKRVFAPIGTNQRDFSTKLAFGVLTVLCIASIVSFLYLYIQKKANAKEHFRKNKTAESTVQSNQAEKVNKLS